MTLLIVAELGSLWGGNPALAYRMVREAALAGADVCKFQFGHDPADPIRGASDKNAEFLRDTCREFGVKFAASFFSLQGLETGRRVGLDYYKIPSQKTYSDPELVEEALKDGVPTWVSHGMTPYAQHWTIEKRFMLPLTIEKRFMLPHIHNVWCISEYPTYPRSLYKMPGSFWRDGFEGYSDHVHGIESCLLAIARGATMVECHFTLNPADQTIRDHAFAKDPKELAELVRLGKRLHRIVEAAR
jgi:sialic acid synthase SpsE